MVTKSDYGMYGLGDIHEPVVLATFLMNIPLLWRVLGYEVSIRDTSGSNRDISAGECKLEL